MFSFLKRIRNAIAPRLSTDEARILALVADRLPPDLGVALHRQMAAVLGSKDAGDHETLVYRLDPKQLVDVGRLTDRPGIVDLARIVISLNQAKQPFVLKVKDGLLYSLKIMNPHPLKPLRMEFEVIEFEFLEGDG
jgi:hypothetical protein